MKKSRLADALQLTRPLIVAPMAGGVSRAELVIASSEAGALGSIGAAYLKPSVIRDQVDEIRARTAKPIAVNLFVPSPVVALDGDALPRAIQATDEYRRELSLNPPMINPPYAEDFERQFQTVLEIQPAVLSFVFGVLSPDHMRRAKEAGLYTIGTATSFSEAAELEQSGVDAITVQGIEAGGHRGMFSASAKDPELTTMELVITTFAKLRVPIIAAGGLMTATEVRTMLAAGADAVQMGTAFLNVKEAGTSAPYRRALAGERKTKTTRAFSGRLARGIENRFMHEMDSKPETILPFPAQNEFTRDLRNASAKVNSSDFLSLWAGTGRGDLWTGPAAELIKILFTN